MLIAAAVCPHPPLLIPEVTRGVGGVVPRGADRLTGAPGHGAGELRRLRAACRDAVAVLLGAAPDLLVVVGGAGQTAEYPPGAGGSLRDFAVPFDRYDDQVAAALAAADPGALAALDPRQDRELFVAGRAAWQVLAGAASAGPVSPADQGGAFAAGLRYAAAPFEVSYYVATWVRAH